MKIKNRVQTNGTLLTSEFIQFFCENNFDIGLSIDEPFDIHTAERGTSIAEYEIILKSLEQLYHCNVHYGILCVVGKKHIGQAQRIFNFLSEHHINHLGFLPCIVQENGVIDNYYTITPKQYGEFLIDFFEIWIHSNIKGMCIRNFDDCIRYYRNKPAKTCINTNSCDRYLTVLPDGKIYLCDNFSVSEEHLVSTIKDGFNEIGQSKPMQWLKQSMQEIPQTCRKCNYYYGCYSGCKYRRWIRNPNMRTGHYYCKTTKLLFEHVGKYLKKEVH